MKISRCKIISLNRKNTVSKYGVKGEDFQLKLIVLTNKSFPQESTSVIIYKDKINFIGQGNGKDLI